MQLDRLEFRVGRTRLNRSDSPIFEPVQPQFFHLILNYLMKMF